MASDTWQTVAVPILEAVAAAEESGTTTNLSAVVQTTGLDRKAVEREVQALIDDEYLTGIDASSVAAIDYIDLRLRPAGKRSLGEWPGDEAYRVLVEVVERRIAEETDPVKRRGWQTLKDGLTAIGTGAGGNLLADLLRSLG